LFVKHGMTIHSAQIDSHTTLQVITADGQTPRLAFLFDCICFDQSDVQKQAEEYGLPLLACCWHSVAAKVAANAEITRWEESEIYCGTSAAETRLSLLVVELGCALVWLDQVCRGDVIYH